ncbi:MULTISPECIES: MFS transporter [unclassified Streptomyces]|uniref:MFS transporter n=1 Tax=Streptomyces sp. gb1(2016) TaxID=1828321 RepID=A0A652KK35_9ACTN|nr:MULTISPECIES: MFS transporter [unclassified Streptomyces]MDX3428939.1 MFS transporter [Streptomyces sp. ME01-18a]TXS24069.1 MFS transporter [Streptomyces sp. gb1(2016)]WSS76112.1 MFS transporter [Streptomyces sp. NBC_01174]
MTQQPVRTRLAPERRTGRVRPPHRPGATLAVTSAATAVALMNYTAPMTALPALSAAFATPPAAQAWLLNGAPLGLAVLLLVAGSLADDFGRRRLFLIGTLGLGVTTALGALATGTVGFTLARAGQGAASAAILASSLGLLVGAYPVGHTRIRAMGVWGAFVSAGIALGPLLAGSLGSLDWRLTYLALGLGALVTGAFAFRALTESRAPRAGRPDLLGAAVLGLAMTALLTALTLGRDGWLRAPVGLLLLAAVALTAVFAAVERGAAAPLIDLALFRSRAFLAATAGGLFTGLSVIGLFSYLPTLLQHALSLSALDAAWLFLLWSGTSFLVALQSRRLAGRVTARHQLAAGFALHAVAVLPFLGALTGGSEPSVWARLIPALIVSGAGSGLINAALPRLAVESVPAERAAMGSGANNTARYLGSSAGVAVTIAVATTPAGADGAVLLSAGTALVATVAVLLLRQR